MTATTFADSLVAEAAGIARIASTGSGPPTVSRVSTARRRSRVFSATFADGTPGLVLKLATTDSVELEAHVMQGVLPQLGEGTIHCLGAWPAREAGHAWLVTEHVETREFDARSPDHVSRYTQWLAALHVKASSSRPVAALPPLEDQHWLGVLAGAIEAVERGVRNTLIDDDDRDRLKALHDVLNLLRSRWPSMRELCSAMPETLVHGDLSPANVKWTATTFRPVVFDWETAGYGRTMIDLRSVDPGQYAEAVSAVWPGSDHETVAKLRALGVVLWVGYVLGGEYENLGSAWPQRAARKAAGYLALVDRAGAAEMVADIP